MITVVAFAHQRRVALFAEQAEAIAVIPAPRPLAEIAADRAHGDDLRAADAFDRGDERGKVLLHRPCSRHIRQACVIAPMRTASRRCFDALELRDILQADHALGRGDALLQRRDQVGAAGEDFRFAPRVRRAAPVASFKVSGLAYSKDFIEASSFLQELQ